MNQRVSTSASVLLHIALLALLSVMSVEQVEKAPPPPGMEIELIDVEHAMALPSPSLAAADAPSDAHESPAPSTPPEAPAPPAPPAQPILAPHQAPAPVAKLAEVVPQLAPASVAPLPKPAPLAATTRQPTAVKPTSTQPVAVAATPSLPAPSKPAPPKPSLNGAALAQMLARRAGTGPQTRINSAAIGSAIGRAAPKGAAGLSVRQRTNLEDMIRSQITPCWNPPVAEEGKPNVTVMARIRLNRDGSVQGDPVVSASKGENVAYARSLAGSVRRAVLRCAPLKLPAELYDAWSDVELNFDPRDVS